jgi:hypothetical protein
MAEFIANATSDANTGVTTVTWTHPTTTVPNTIITTGYPGTAIYHKDEKESDFDERMKKIELAIQDLDKKMDETVKVLKIIKNALLDKGIAEIADLL